MHRLSTPFIFASALTLGIDAALVPPHIVSRWPSVPSSRTIDVRSSPSSSIASLVVSGGGRHRPATSTLNDSNGPSVITSSRSAQYCHAKLPTRLHAHRSSSSTSKEDTGFSSSFTSTLHKYRVLLRCLWAITAYVAVGVFAFSRVFEQWPVVDSLYFCVTTFTTVGYGDLSPTTEAGRLFTVFYSFSGISIVGALLGYVGGTVVEAERAAVRKTRAAARAAVMEIFDPNRKGGGKGGDDAVKSRVSRAVEGGSDSNGTSGKSKPSGLSVLRNLLSRAFSLRKRSDGSKSLLRGAFDAFTDNYYIFVPFLALALFMGKAEGWSPITSVYYALATATTVGYGDVAPTGPRTRLLATLFIPLAVVSLGEVLGRIAGFFIRKETNRAEHEFMDRRMTLDDLDVMDTNRDGRVDLFEFLTFMLGSMQKVDKEMMDDLKGLFEKLDASGDGYLHKDDLILMGRRNRDPWMLKRKGSSS